MTVKSIHSPFHGRSVKFGRRRPADLGPHAELRSYLDTKALPPPPATCDYSTAAKRSLNNVYLNDQLGDCVIAGGAHVRGVTSGGAGDLVTFSKEEIIKTASAGLLQPALGRGQRHPLARAGKLWSHLPLRRLAAGRAGLERRRARPRPAGPVSHRLLRARRSQGPARATQRPVPRHQRQPGREAIGGRGFRELRLVGWNHRGGRGLARLASIDVSMQTEVEVSQGDHDAKGCRFKALAIHRCGGRLCRHVVDGRCSFWGHCAKAFGQEQPMVVLRYAMQRRRLCGFGNGVSRLRAGSGRFGGVVDRKSDP